MCNFICEEVEEAKWSHLIGWEGLCPEWTRTYHCVNDSIFCALTNIGCCLNQDAPWEDFHI